MKTLIVYYSRTGTTAKVAQHLAAALKADMIDIKCARYRPGWLRYLCAGYDSVKGIMPPIDVPRIQPLKYDLILLGAPIWTSYPALPLRSFLALGTDLPSRVALFLTYGGHSSPDKAIAFVANLLPVALEATLSVRQENVDGRGLPAVTESLLKQLRAPLEQKKAP